MKHEEWLFLEDGTLLQRIRYDGIELKLGDRVVLRPQGRGAILDVALDGKTAIIESIEQDYEGRIHLAVVLHEDPGQDLGALRQPGHRFFFLPEEVMLL